MLEWGVDIIARGLYMGVEAHYLLNAHHHRDGRREKKSSLLRLGSFIIYKSPLARASDKGEKIIIQKEMKIGFRYYYSWPRRDSSC